MSALDRGGPAAALKLLGACKPALDWVGDRDARSAWRECPRADWLVWAAAKGADDVVFRDVLRYLASEARLLAPDVDHRSYAGLCEAAREVAESPKVPQRDLQCLALRLAWRSCDDLPAKRAFAGLHGLFRSCGALSLSRPSFAGGASACLQSAAVAGELKRRGVAERDLLVLLADDRPEDPHAAVKRLVLGAGAVRARAALPFDVVAESLSRTARST